MSRKSLRWLRISLGLLTGIFLWLMWQASTITSPELESLKLRYHISRLLFGSNPSALNPDYTVVSNWRGLLPLAILFGLIFSILQPLQRFIALVSFIIIGTSISIYCLEAFKLVIPLGGPAIVLCCSYLCGTLIHLETEKIERNRNLALDLQLNAESERKRIAKDLHDESLPAIQQAIRLTDKMLPLVADTAIPSSIRTHLEESIAAMRRIIDDLHPSALEEFGLLTSLDHLVTQFSRRTGICAALKNKGGGDISLPSFHELCIYRICQEALNNIEKHAHASEVKIDLEHNERVLRLSIADNGSGTISKKIGSHGLINMEHRAKLIGGKLKWQSIAAPASGTVLSLTLPRAARSETEDTKCQS